jgi:hypothetical protein
MWQNSDFKQAFKEYAPMPPQKVWENIVLELAHENQKPIGFWSFNSAQKYTLIAACLCSVLFSTFIFKYNSNEQFISINKIESKTQFSSRLEDKSIADPIVNLSKTESKPKGIAVANKINTFTPRHIDTKKNIQQIHKELIPFKKEIKELYEIDQAIARLNIELNELESISTSSISTEIVYTSTYNSSQERTLNLAEFKTKKEVEASLAISTIKHKDSVSFFENILSKLYLTPFVGANFTQVSYSNSSNSPYFSEHANFTGKLGYNAGLQFGYQFNKKWSLESGISFGQYLQNFNEKLNSNSIERNGIMYIDQLDIPLLARYTIPLNKKELPINLSFKGGFIYNSVLQYQVNYADEFKLSVPPQNLVKAYNIDADKRTYNSLQLGYVLGMDFEAYFSKKIALNLSMLNAYVSQLENFPTLTSDARRPRQFSTTFSIGTKIKF